MGGWTLPKRLSGGITLHLPESLVVLSFYALEILRASLSEAPLPVGIPYFLLGGSAVLAACVLLTFTLRRLLRGRPHLWPGCVSLLAVLFVGVKLLPVEDASTAFLTGLYLVGPFVAVAFAERTRFKSLDYRRAWCVVLTLLAVVSTDAVRIAWRWTGGWELGRLASGLVLAGLLGLAAWSFTRVWGDVRRILEARWKTSLTAALIGLVLTGGLWHTTWTPRLVQQGTQDFTPAEASVDEPPLPDGSTLRDLPNIVLISVDTLRWDMVPPRANHLDLPTLEKLRRDSLVFEKAFSTSGWTLPAHASLFSGLVPIQHGAMLPHNWIYRTLPLYPQYLRKIGYRTAAFTDAGYVDKVYGFCRGIDLCWEQREPFPDYPHTGYVPGGLELSVLLLAPFHRGPSVAFSPAASVTEGPPRTRKLRYFSRNLEAARGWLEHGSDPRPFFIFLHTFEAHDAGRVYPEPYRRLRREAPGLASAISPSGPPAVSDRTLKDRAKKRLYEYGVEAVDRSLGGFLRWMKRRDLYDDTLIVFVSDHGEGFMLEHGIRGHAGVQEVLTRVPLWIKFPDGRFADRAVEPFVQLSDVFPLTFRHLGIELPPGGLTGAAKGTWTERAGLSVPARSLVPTSLAWKIDANEHLPPEEKRVKLAVRGSRYKLEKIRGEDTGTFWRVGPKTLKQTPVAPGTVPPSIRVTLRDRWEQHLDLYAEYPNPYLRDDPTLTDPMIENLRGLGYMQ